MVTLERFVVRALAWSACPHSMASGSMKFVSLVSSDVEFAQQVLEAPASTLCVVDAYAEWCGPCTGLGKKITNMAGDYIECAQAALML